jgi:hypothetical protein
MATVTEIIKASSKSGAIEEIASLYPTMTDYQILSRRNEAGQFSKRGHTFMVKVKFEAAEEPAPEDLGEEQY